MARARGACRESLRRPCARRDPQREHCSRYPGATGRSSYGAAQSGHSSQTPGVGEFSLASDIMGDNQMPPRCTIGKSDQETAINLSASALASTGPRE